MQKLEACVYKYIYIYINTLDPKPEIYMYMYMYMCVTHMYTYVLKNAKLPTIFAWIQQGHLEVECNCC